MNNWNQMDPYNLEYIEKQVKAIKEKQNIANETEETEEAETRQIEEILEEQLIILYDIKHTLDKLADSKKKTIWQRLF